MLLNLCVYEFILARQQFVFIICAIFCCVRVMRAMQQTKKAALKLCSKSDQSCCSACNKRLCIYIEVSSSYILNGTNDVSASIFPFIGFPISNRHFLCDFALIENYSGHLMDLCLGTNCNANQHKCPN